MKKWPMLLICTFEASIVLATVYFEPTYCVRGKLWGEAFFDGRPTSYWRAELERWEAPQAMRFGSERFFYIYHRNRTLFEKLQRRFSEEIWLNEPDFMFNGPAIVANHADAQPVLKELLEDPSVKVRLFAQIGLGMNPEPPRGH